MDFSSRFGFYILTFIKVHSFVLSHSCWKLTLTSDKKVIILPKCLFHCGNSSFLKSFLRAFTFWTHCITEETMLGFVKLHHSGFHISANFLHVINSSKVTLKFFSLSSRKLLNRPLYKPQCSLTNKKVHYWYVNKGQLLERSFVLSYL